MTPQEFKAWFDGFIEGMVDEVPTPAQWVKIKDMVAEIWIPMTVTQTIDPNATSCYPYSIPNLPATLTPYVIYTGGKTSNVTGACDYDGFRASDTMALTSFGRSKPAGVS